ncbi:hypothetical protein JCM8202_000819 [Rhodotorula sphaerocarpa]
MASQSWQDRHKALSEALAELPRELHRSAASPDEQLHRVLLRTQDAPPTAPSAIGPTKRLRAAALSLDDFPALSTLSATDWLSRVELVRPAASLTGASNARGATLYVMKSVDKRWAFRMRTQQSHIHELAVLRLGRQRSSDPARIPRLIASFLSPSSFHIVLSHVPGGDVWSLLEEQNMSSSSVGHPGGLREAWVKGWMAELFDAVAWLHASGWAHRDVKPHNMLLSADGHLLLTDFGSAAPLTTGTTSMARKYCRALVGTPDYIAPEILLHAEALYRDEMDSDDEDDEASRTFSSVERKERPGAEAAQDPQSRAYGAEVDWWSCGVVMYELLYGVAPFFAEHIPHTYDRVKRWRESLVFPADSSVSLGAQDLIRRLLRDPQARPSFDKLKTLPYFASVSWDSLRSQPPAYRPAVASETVSSSPSLTRSQRSFAQSFDVDSFMSSPGLSILRPSPRTRDRAQDEERQFWEASEWGGLTTLPEPDEFDCAISDAASRQSAQASSRSSSRTSTPSSFETPARPRPIGSGKQSAPASTLARRTIGGLEAWREMQEHAWSVGRSAKKRMPEAPPNPRQLAQERRSSESQLGGLQAKQEDVIRQIDDLNRRYEGLFALAAAQGRA